MVLSTRSNSMSKLEAQPECARRVNTHDGSFLVAYWFGTCPWRPGSVRDNG